jgi:hypothetical protein
MSPAAGSAPVQLLVYRFGPGTAFDGALVGALERLEVDGSIRVLDVLFLRSNPDTGEPEAVQPGGEGIASMLVALLDFRLDPDKRRQTTDRALADDEGIPGAELRALADSLAPGAGLVAVLIEHAWTQTLDDAVGRMGGAPILARFVDASALAGVTAELRAAAGD